MSSIPNDAKAVRTMRRLLVDAITAQHQVD